MESRPRAGRVAVLIPSHCRCPAPPHELPGKEKNTTALQGVCLDLLFLTGPLSVHEKGSVETKYGGVGTTARPQARSCTQKAMKARGVGAGAPLWKPHPGGEQKRGILENPHVSDNKGLWPSDTRV